MLPVHGFRSAGSRSAVATQPTRRQGGGKVHHGNRDKQHRKHPRKVQLVNMHSPLLMAPHLSSHPPSTHPSSTHPSIHPSVHPSTLFFLLFSNVRGALTVLHRLLFFCFSFIICDKRELPKVKFMTFTHAVDVVTKVTEFIWKKEEL